MDLLKQSNISKRSSDQQISDPPVFRQRGAATFGTGVLTGAAFSSVVPWHMLESVDLATRVGALAGICAGFVLVRLAFRSKAIKRTSRTRMLAKTQ